MFEASRSPTQSFWDGMPVCPWMKLPRNIRYPRFAAQIAPEANEVVRDCIQRLNKRQDDGEILWAPEPATGSLLQPVALGGWHGATHDLDWDYSVLLRRDLPTEDLCRAAQVPDYIIGIWDLTVLAHQLRPQFAHRCRCEYQELPVPCPTNAYALLDREFAPSWWVPIRKGGKNINTAKLPQWGDHNGPERKSSWFMSMGKDSLEVLRDMDRSNDGNVDMSEVERYLSGQESFNMEWYKYSKRRSPCRLVNGQVHLNHTLWWFTLIDRALDHEWVANKPADLRKVYVPPRFERRAELCRAILDGRGQSTTHSPPSDHLAP